MDEDHTPAGGIRPRGRKIGVLTFHRCFNYGSYWQARCLVEGLRAAGHDAELLNHECRQVNRAEGRCLLHPGLPDRTRPSDLPLYKAKGRKFIKAINELPASSRFSLHRPEETKRYDVVVIGSDEVWNFQHPWYGGNPIFFGSGLKADRIVSYAASFGNHDAADGMHPWWSARLRAFAAISVRDANSRHIVGEATGTAPELVLDPCLQFVEHVEAPAISSPRPYALVYGHGFPDWLITRLQRWSLSTGIRLVSVGYRNACADEQRISAGPDEFAGLMAGASSVITNFFHGCVFALLNRKPFISAPSAYRFNKVRDLAAALGMEHRLVSGETPQRRFAELLDTPPERGVTDRMDELSHRSGSFLDAALS